MNFVRYSIKVTSLVCIKNTAKLDQNRLGNVKSQNNGGKKKRKRWIRLLSLSLSLSLYSNKDRMLKSRFLYKTWWNLRYKVMFLVVTVQTTKSKQEAFVSWRNITTQHSKLGFLVRHISRIRRSNAHVHIRRHT